MVTIQVDANCGNSPKMKFIKDFLIHFANLDKQKILDAVAADIIWNTVGFSTVEGFDDFASYLDKLKQDTDHLQINSIVTHGKEAAASGEFVLKDGTRFGFGDFYTFSSTKGDKIKSITSFNILVE